MEDWERARVQVMSEGSHKDLWSWLRLAIEIFPLLIPGHC
jgi:hypothetical protein